jgi:translation initiation factor 2D
MSQIADSTRKSSLNPATSLKTAAEAYITKNALADPANQRYVRLDDELGKAVGVKNPGPGEKITREEVIKRLRAGVAWSVSIGGQVK